MALPLGKLTILVGAGILGSVLAKEGRASDLLTGAFKIAWKKIAQNDTTPAVKRPNNDSLMTQMNNLRQELQIMASSRPVTIVTTSRSGTSKVGIVIVVVVVGYGFIWWKGWRLPDMMFATRRSLNEARDSVGKQLENVFSSMSEFRRNISSKIDGVEHNLDSSIENSVQTQQEVTKLRGRTDTISVDFRKVHDAVLTLETKISRIEGKQGETTYGVWKLCDYAMKMEKCQTAELIQASPSSFCRPALELPPASPSSLVTPTKSSRPALELPPTSSSRENNGNSEAAEVSNRGGVSNGFRAPEGTNNAASSTSRFGFGFGFGFPSFNTSAILRTRSATSGMVQQKGSTTQQL